jgi:hypothetical protein
MALDPARSLRRRLALAPALVLVGALAAAGGVLLAAPTMVPGEHAFALRPIARHGVRVWRDDFDVAVYAQRGSFALIPGARPYVEVPCEYPVLAAYLFALPFTIVHSFPGYRAVFTCLMALTLGGLAFVLAELCRVLGRSPLRVLCVLLPATLYFALNRFDAVPVLLASAALLLLVHTRWALAFALLAAAVLTKAYPVLYAPLFASYALQHGGRRGLAHGLLGFAAVIAGSSLQLALWAGPDAVLEPFQFQLGRMQNAESLYYLLSHVLPALGSPAGQGLFTALQVAPAVAALWVRPSTPESMLRWATAVTVAFVLFSRFQSPQWIVWITPLAAVAARGWRELALVAVIDAVTFAYFPLAYDAIGPRTAVFTALIAVLSLLRAVHQGVLLSPPALLTGRNAAEPTA